MKQEIHPENYRPVIFHDTASGERFLVSSTIESNETEKWEDGNEYPKVEIEISSASHPFYTGQEKTLDTTGRVEKFKQRQQQAQKQTAESKQHASKQEESSQEEQKSTASEGSISIDASEVESDN